MRLHLTLLSLALPLATSLAGCNSPQEKTPVTLPASVAGRDSVQQALITPVQDAASTSADSTATRSSVTPR